MDVQENCIQLKIDLIIADINQNCQENQTEEKNQITALMGYNHCLDLFEFLNMFSKIQKSELLVQVGIIYDSIGYAELSMDCVNESLLLVPNVPSIILYKSSLFASLNRLDEAQKWLVKYKYIIGENKYDNYIHDSFQVIFYYLLEYEEYIIIRKINSIENRYYDYVKENFVIFYIKSKTLEKLAKKFKNSDNKRYNSYIKESNEIRYKYIDSKKNETEFLLEQGIRSENITKLLILINPSFLNYKPKKLIEYNNSFKKNGFSLFFTIIMICKKLKLEIMAKKYKKIFKGKNDNENEINNINDIIKLIQESSPNINNNISNENSNDENIKICQETIKKLYNSVWLSRIKSKNNKNNNDIKDKKLDGKNSLKTNYYISEGYYSKLNLKESILKNIEYNNEFKSNKITYDSLLEEIKNEEVKNISENKNIDNKNTENQNNKDIEKVDKKEEKKAVIAPSNTNNKIKSNPAKNNLSDIIKKIIIDRSKERKRHKRNINDNNNKESKNSKKYCSTDNCGNNANNMLSKSTKYEKKKKTDSVKIDSNSLFSRKKRDGTTEKKIKEDKKTINEKEKEKIYDEYNKLKDENKKEKIRKPKEKVSNNIEKSNNFNNYLGKKISEKDNKSVNNKNKLLTTNTSNKKITLVSSVEQSKTQKKNSQNNPIRSYREEKKLDTEHGKHKDIREINLVSYCLRQLMKKKENKNKNLKQKEFANLTDKLDFMIPQKMMDIEKQIYQINEHKYIKSKSKKKKVLNNSIKKQINVMAFEKRMKKNINQKSSDNNLIKTNKSSYSINHINFNSNMKNLKKTINHYGYKKDITKFQSLNYLNGNFYSNNNYLNINFNNYMNYNFNYTNRHDDKKNFDFKFNPNSDYKRREESYSKEKLNFRTINLDYKNMSTKLNTHRKKPLLNSFVDSKEKNKKSSDNKYDFVIIPFNKMKNSPSGEMHCLKKKIKNFKTNLVKQKTKTSFSKYMLYNIAKKCDTYYFSKSINTSEYNKYKNSSNKSKNMKRKYNKTITNKSNSRIINK